MNRYIDILDYWFGDLNDNTTLTFDSPIIKKWFTKSDATDEDIRQNFNEDLIKAHEGAYLSWEIFATGRLALIILFDQFSRNIYRNTHLMFATDPLALNLTLRSIADGSDQELPLIQRKFMYMPLMHSEDLDVQKKSLEYYSKIVQTAKEQFPQNASYFENTLDFAQKHYDIVKRFGRFPHRNASLNRNSTDEEKKFLETPNSSF